MNLALAAGTFAVILPAELPDKTFISAIVLASKHRPFPVWVGTAGGLVVQAGIGVAAGRLLALLPHRTVEAIVAGLFLAGAAYLLFVPERAAEVRGVAVARREEEELAEDEALGDLVMGDELRAGLAALAEVYRKRLASGGQATRTAVAAIELIDEATSRLALNVNETLLAEWLLLELDQLG